MALKEKRDGEVAILYPRDYYMGGTETDELDKRLAELYETGYRRVVLNLQDCRHLNATALAVLIKWHSRFTKIGANLVLSCIDKNIKNIFVITKLAMVFRFFETEQQAVAG